MLKLNRLFCFGFLLTLVQFLSAQTVPLSVEKISVSPNGELEVRLNGENSHYYRLVKFDLVARGQRFLDLQMTSPDQQVDLRSSGISGRREKPRALPGTARIKYA